LNDGVGEKQEKRIELDKKGVKEIIKVWELYLNMEDIKFCPAREREARRQSAIIVKFYTEYARSILLQ
jgi:hypothetical protein